MRISDWSSDVCSSDLLTGRANSTMSRSGPEIGRTKPSRKMLWRRIGQLLTSPIFYSVQDPLIAPSRFASKWLIPNGIEYGSPPCVRHCEPAKRVKQSRAVWPGRSGTALDCRAASPLAMTKEGEMGSYQRRLISGQGGETQEYVAISRLSGAALGHFDQIPSGRPNGFPQIGRATV